MSRRSGKPRQHATNFRPYYAVALAAVAGLLWLLTLPKPGVRTVTLEPVLAPEADARWPEVPERVRVATYNLEHFTDGRGDGTNRTPEVFMTHAKGAAEIIDEARPDVLMLQEIENGRTLEYLNAQLKEPFPYIYISRLRTSSNEREKLNLAMMSRLHPVQVRQLSFQKLRGFGRPTRGTLAAEFVLGQEARLLVYNVHLKSNFGEAPRNQAQRGIALHYIAADAISAELGNVPARTGTIILGDTNVDPDTEQFAADPSLRPLTGGYRDLWLGRPIEERTTIPTRQAGDTNLVFPPSAFDRIFASCNLAEGTGFWRVGRPESIQRGTATHDNTVQPGLDGHISDHYLAYVDIQRDESAEETADVIPAHPTDE